MSSMTRNSRNEENSNKELSVSNIMAIFQRKEVSLEILDELPPYEKCQEIEEELKSNNKLNFENVFHEPTGYYFFRLFLISEYSGPKCVFLKDVESYRRVRYNDVRYRVARWIYKRFIADEEAYKDMIPRNRRHASTFTLMQEKQRRIRQGSSPDSLSPLTSMSNETDILHIGSTNAIGVYGGIAETVKDQLELKDAPKNLFDEAFEEVMTDVLYDLYPRFCRDDNPLYQNYIRTKAVELKPVTINDFDILKLMGRGGFGEVAACRKKNSGAIYAIKSINKKLLKYKKALYHVLEERAVLQKLSSPFVDIYQIEK